MSNIAAYFDSPLPPKVGKKGEREKEAKGEQVIRFPIFNRVPSSFSYVLFSFRARPDEEELKVQLQDE